LWAKLLSGKVGSEPRQLREGLSAITSGAEAQKELIEDLLDISRITSGSLRLQMHKINPSMVVQAAVDAIVPVAEAKGVHLTSDITPDIGIVLADSDRLRQVVWNLLTNAVKFTPPQGEVSVAIRQIDGEAEIRVSDSGRGVSVEFLPHVFERFSQAEAATTRTQGGMGLGLAIAKQLVELHSGTIFAESAGPNLGATFIVRLPLSEISIAGSSSARWSKKQPRKQDISKLQGVRVLLVEDDPMTRQALANVLGNAGMLVSETGSADAALESFVQNPPGLIVTDVGMPEKDGYTLLKEIRASEARLAIAQVPAVALTAFARDSDRSRAIEAGFQEHIPKPVDADRLVESLYEVLFGKSAQ
jgi:CheY-like chemotaxis protein